MWRELEQLPRQGQIMLYRSTAQGSEIFALPSPADQHRLRQSRKRIEKMPHDGLLVHRLCGQHNRAFDLGDILPRNEPQHDPCR